MRITIIAAPSGAPADSRLTMDTNTGAVGPIQLSGGEH
jgi:hypothetical protein